MNLQEIKDAVTEGKNVYWANKRYKVVKDKIGQWLITCDGGSAIGLTHQDGVTMNGEEDEFFMLDENGEKMKNVKATGEADQDYDIELFDKICSKIKDETGLNCFHKEFDKYQGVYIKVGGLKFWIKDIHFTGEKEGKDKKYSSAFLMNEDGDKTSATKGDYFQMKDNYIFKGYTLILTDSNGEKQVIENPKKSQLPDLMDVGNSFTFKEGAEQTIYDFIEESNPEEEISITVKNDEIIDMDMLIEYIKANTSKTNASAKGNKIEGEEDMKKDDERMGGHNYGENNMKSVDKVFITFANGEVSQYEVGGSFVYSYETIEEISYSENRCELIYNNDAENEEKGTASFTFEVGKNLEGGAGEDEGDIVTKISEEDTINNKKDIKSNMDDIADTEYKKISEEENENIDFSNLPTVKYLKNSGFSLQSIINGYNDWQEQNTWRKTKQENIVSMLKEGKSEEEIIKIMSNTKVESAKNHDFNIDTDFDKEDQEDEIEYEISKKNKFKNIDEIREEVKNTEWEGGDYIKVAGKSYIMVEYSGDANKKTKGKRSRYVVYADEDTLSKEISIDYVNETVEEQDAITDWVATGFTPKNKNNKTEGTNKMGIKVKSAITKDNYETAPKEELDKVPYDKMDKNLLDKMIKTVIKYIKNGKDDDGTELDNSIDMEGNPIPKSKIATAQDAIFLTMSDYRGKYDRDVFGLNSAYRNSMIKYLNENMGYDLPLDIPAGTQRNFFIKESNKGTNKMDIQAKIKQLLGMGISEENIIKIMADEKGEIESMFETISMALEDAKKRNSAGDHASLSACFDYLDVAKRNIVELQKLVDAKVQEKATTKMPTEVPAVPPTPGISPEVKEEPTPTKEAPVQTENPVAETPKEEAK
jgi:hypothetical protein